VNADGIADWVRTFARTAAGHPERSPLVQATSAHRIKVKLDRKVVYEVDGGGRRPVKSFTIKVQPSAITICVPRNGSDGGDGD
jgi:diacylglycerol kinase family enzyme